MITDTADCEACDEAIKQLEQIDDDADAVGVMFVKTDEAEFAAEYGIETFPAILYFENKQPSIYDGNFNILIISFKICNSNTWLHLKVMQQRKQSFLLGFSTK